MMKNKAALRFILVTILFAILNTANAQQADNTEKEEKEIRISLSRLTLGGYGEAVATRNFFSDNINRYTHASSYKDAKSHGRVDMPHVTFMVGYEFGKGWRMNAEVEFEHGGTEAAVELEAEEAGEYESEIERGGEVALEQFWIEKTISAALNIRLGHIVVPIGYTNANHLPTEFFTVYRPEGESTIMPCTWHETGISVWGILGKWRYEAQLIPALDSELFDRTGWVHGGSASPYEFKIANKVAGVLRVDNYSIPGLRMGVSGYYGHSFNNNARPTDGDRYKNTKGAVTIGTFDFEYKGYNLIARGYFDYGHLGDSESISQYNRSRSKNSPSPRTNVASDAIAIGFEAGYDIFSQIGKMAEKEQKLYLFGRYEYYDSMYKTAANVSESDWCGRQRVVGGLNYFPLKQVVIKAEYSAGLLKSQYNNENSISIGVAYAGLFTR